MSKKGEEEKGEGQYTVNVGIGGETLKQVIAIRGNREKETGRITPVAELVREAIGYWYKKGGLRENNESDC